VALEPVVDRHVESARLVDETLHLGIEKSDYINVLLL